MKGVWVIDEFGKMWERGNWRGRAGPCKLFLRPDSKYFWPSRTYSFCCKYSTLPSSHESSHGQYVMNECGSVPINFIYGHRNLNCISFSHVGKDDSSFDIFQPFKNKDILSSWAVKKNRWWCEPHSHITIGQTHGWRDDWSSWTVVSQGWGHQRRIKGMDARETQRYLMQIRYFATH